MRSCPLPGYTLVFQGPSQCPRVLKHNMPRGNPALWCSPCHMFPVVDTVFSFSKLHTSTKKDQSTNLFNDRNETTYQTCLDASKVR